MRVNRLASGAQIFFFPFFHRFDVERHSSSSDVCVFVFRFAATWAIVCAQPPILSVVMHAMVGVRRHIVFLGNCLPSSLYLFAIAELYKWLSVTVLRVCIMFRWTEINRNARTAKVLEQHFSICL